MAFGRQLKLLLWKNFTLRKRQWIRFIIELLWPLVLFLILGWIKVSRGLQEHIHECHFDGKAMPSAGTLPFLQTFLCTTNNTCHDTIRPDERPGFVNDYRTALISELFIDVETLMTNQTELGALTDLLRDWQTLQTLLEKTRNGDLNCTFTLGDLLVDPNKIREEVRNQSLGLSQDTLNQLFNSSLNLTELITLFPGILGNLANLTAGSGSQIASVLRNALCDGDRPEELLQLPNYNRTDRMVQELCNLTQEEFLELVNDFRGDLNVTNILGMLNECVQRANLSFITNQELMLDRLNLFRDLMALESLGNVASEFNKVLQTVMESRNAVNGSNSTASIMGQLMCGRSQGIFETVDETPDTLEQFSGNDDKKKDQDKYKYVYENDTTEFCNEVFADFETQRNLRILWRQIKPIVRGKLVYTPDTPAVRTIIKQANATFENLARVKKFAQDWLDASPSIYDYISTNPVIADIRKTLNQIQNSTAQMDFLLMMLANYIGPDRINQIRGILENENLRDFLSDNSDSPYNWRNILNMTDQYMELARNYMDCFDFDKFEAFDTEHDLVSYGLDLMKDNKLWAGLVFDMEEEVTDNLPGHISYKIRMDMGHVDTTAKFKVLDRYWRPGPRARPLPDMKYLVYGFSYLQDMVEHAIIRLQTSMENDTGIGIHVQQFPYPCYIIDRFSTAISRTMPLFMTLAWIYTVSMVVKGIVQEKERRLKEVMKVMGLGNGIHWLAWFITSFIMMMLSVFLLLIVLKGFRVLEHSDPSVLLVFMLSFTLATIMQCFMFSVWFSKANLAAACAGIIYFCSYLPYSLCVNYQDYMRAGHKALACLSSTVAFGLGCGYIADYEEQGIGLQWYNIDQSVAQDDDFSMLGCIIMLLVDTVIYAIITWYVEAVFPGQYGVPKSWYFFVTRSYWCGTRYARDVTPASNQSVEMDQNQRESGKFEADPTHLRLGVSIKGLKKVYKKGKTVAVDGLNLNFYENHITSFLGHNGAGKTTTMSILTGLFPPTEGTAYVDGKDIRRDMDEIRENMGTCPQHNVLFDLLTVEEHLWFYASLRGMPSDDVKKEIEKMIYDIGLPHKRSEQSRNLSGGMKRKLSVAMAFVAGSKVVFLDEPTAGVDPYARRSIWDLLMKYRQGRTVIISTHFMDEADILGDRIAIIAQGKVRCCGSSLFLKSKFGSGYYLTLVKAHHEDRPVTASSQRTLGDVKLQSDESGQLDEGVADLESNKSSAATSTTEADDTEAAVTSFIQRCIPEAKLAEVVGSELNYQLPDDRMTVAGFKEFFIELDNNLEELGITGYGISDTTLEEVFLRVADEVDEAPEDGGVNMELRRQRTEMLTDGGAYARPVTRLSFRKSRRNFLGLNKKTTDQQELTNSSQDSDSVIELEEAEQGGYVSSIPMETIKQCNGAGSYQVRGFPLVRRQFWALILKRFHYVRRSKKGFVSQIILPAFFICLAMVFAMINPPIPEQPPMEIHPWLLAPKAADDKRLYMFYSNDEPDREWTQRLEDLVVNKSGVGTRCMDPSVYQIPNYPCEIGTIDSWTDVEGDVNITKPCSCQTGYQVCPADAAGPEPARRQLDTTDIIFQMSDRNITDWLVKTNRQFLMKRYGGLSFGELYDIPEVNSTSIESIFNRLMVAANGGVHPGLQTDFPMPPLLDDLEKILETMGTKKNTKVWFNNKGYVSMVAYTNVMNNLILRSNLHPDQNPARFGMTLTNHPMNRTRAQLTDFIMQAGAVDVLIAISVIFAMSFIPASFILFLIEERVSNSKHLQFVSGVNPTIYWVANFCWDMVNYMVAALLCIMIFLAFQQEAYVSSRNAPCLVSLLLLYGWAVTPMMYPASFLFSTPSTAFVALSCLNVFLGIVSTVATFMLQLFNEEDLDAINKILMSVFLLLPHYCLGRGLIDLTSNQLQSDAMASLGEDVFRNPFEWTLVGRNLMWLVLLGVFFFFLNLCIQYKFWINKIYPRRHSTPVNQTGIQEDEDVARERQRVTSGAAAAEDVLVIDGLTKVYRKKLNCDSLKQCRAVDNVSLGIHPGECFGLLGVNGAGKTTTFRMLTGDTTVTSGTAQLAGYSILTDMVQVHQHLGYCPQFDALNPLLTGEEHLQFYARLRGVPEEDVKLVAAWGLVKLGLIKYADKCAGDYSGGNKRKLSTAMALVGNPPVIFLDEPTTGMDPKARRFLWNCITNVLRDGRSIMLTSHSMEECEALCGRIAIMVNGSFKCLGSIQHLKNRFGEGYTLILRVSGSEAQQLDGVTDFICSTFRDAQLKERHHNMLQFQLGVSESSLSAIFGHIESVRDRFNIEDYSVCQTTLDQVFIYFAKQQTDLLYGDLLEAVEVQAQYPPEQACTNQDQRLTERLPHVPLSPKKRATDTHLDGLGKDLADLYDDESIRGSTVDLVGAERRPDTRAQSALPKVSQC